MQDVGIAIAGAGALAPADKAIYALRDATGTVDSMPLIGSSIVAKKAATGAGYLLYDVKRGSGAFMKTTAEAHELAHLLVRLSESMGIRAAALVTDMDTPLGSAVGNALEVRESVAFLRGEPTRDDLAGVARHVAQALLELSGVEDARGAVERALASGAAHEKLVALVRAQGGDAAALEDLPVSRHVREVPAPRDGYVARLDADGVARAALALGAGRRHKEDALGPRRRGRAARCAGRAGDRGPAGGPALRRPRSRPRRRARRRRARGRRRARRARPPRPRPPGAVTRVSPRR